MTHSHDHHDHYHQSGENIKLAFWLNFGFSLLEFAGGFYSNSVAILSNALHDLGDSFSLLLAWYFHKVSDKKRDAKYSYGYKRFSLLGAYINSIVLLVGSIFIIIESVKRFTEPAEPKAMGMIVFAVAGVVVNALAMVRLQKGASMNERVVSLHFLEDLLGWISVLIAAVVMLFVRLPMLDSILSLGIAAFILFNIYRNVRSSMKVILQGVPEDVDEEKVLETILSEAHVLSVHDLHIWSMDGEYSVLTAHLVVDKTIAAISETEILKASLRDKLIKLRINHPTFELEHEDSGCSGGC